MPRSNDGGIRAVAGMEVGPFVGAVNKAIGSMSAMAKKAGFLGTVLAGTGVIIGYQLAKALINSAKEMKKYQLVIVEFAKVLKGGIPEAQVVAQNIGQLSKIMPTAREELFRVAQTAARLGIRGTKNIKEFTRVASMMGVATDLSADIAADAFARILKQTQTPVAQFEQLGSVVNELANNMATTTSEIVENMRRNAPDMARLGFNAGEIAAVAAAVNEVSESATRAGTRIRRFAQSISDPNKLQVFAGALGMSATALRDMFKVDSVGALMKIVAAFREGGDAADILASNLDSRVRQVLAQLAQNFGGLNMALGIYNEQMVLQNSLNREYALFADTIVSRQQLIKNTIAETNAEIGKNLEGLMMQWYEFRLMLSRGVNRLFSDPLDLSAPREEVDKFREDWEELEEQIHRVIAAKAKWDDSRSTFLGSTDPSTGKRRPGTGIEVVGMGRQREEALAVTAEMSKSVEYLDQQLQTLGMTSMFASEILFDQMIITGRLAQANANATGDFSNFAEEMAGSRMQIDQLTSALYHLEQGMEHADPAAVGLAENMLTMYARMNQEGTLVFEDMLQGIAGMNHFMWNFGTAAQRMATSGGVYSDSAAQLIKSLEAQKEVAKYGRLEAILYSDAWDEANDGQKEQIRTAVEWLIAEEKRLEALKEEEDRLEELRLAQEKYDESLKTLTRDLKDRIALGAAVTEEEKLQVERYKEMRDALEGLTFMDSLYVMGLLGRAWALEDAANAQEKLVEVTSDAEKEWERIEKRLADMNLETLASQFRLMERVIDGMADSFVDAFEALVTGSGNAGEAIITMIRDIAAELLKAQVMKFLFNLASQWGLGPFNEVNAWKNAKYALGTAGRYGLFPAMADGGSLRGGQMALVGERGPEMFVPSVSGTVVPNDKLSQMGNTVVLNNHYTIQALDGASVREVLAREQKFITGMSIDSIQRHRVLSRN